MDDKIIKVPEADKTLTPGKLFYNWFAANIESWVLCTAPLL